MENLAFEFGVTRRTILRDIDALSLSHPIYTQCGRHGGGVYVTEGYYLYKDYISDEEAAVLQAVRSGVGEYESKVIGEILRKHKRPSTKK